MNSRSEVLARTLPTQPHTAFILLPGQWQNGTTKSYSKTVPSYFSNAPPSRLPNPSIPRNSAILNNCKDIAFFPPTPSSAPASLSPSSVSASAIVSSCSPLGGLFPWRDLGGVHQQFHKKHRVHPRSFHRQSPMQVRSRDAPGSPNFSQHRARFQNVARFYVNLRKVPVKRVNPESVIQHDRVP